MANAETIPVLEFPQAHVDANSDVIAVMGPIQASGFAILEVGPVRFCKDCKWFGAGVSPHCLSPKNFHTVRSLVTGDEHGVPYQTYCEVHRYSQTPENRCGASGRWFEPRESEQTEAAQ